MLENDRCHGAYATEKSARIPPANPSCKIDAYFLPIRLSRVLYESLAPLAARLWHTFVVNPSNFPVPLLPGMRSMSTLITRTEKT